MNTSNTLLAITYQPRTFTNPALNKATERIAKLYLDAKNYAEDKNRTLASILAEVKVKELYKDDGFSSVADYAEATFGIKRANAYTLASAGEVYNDKTASENIRSLTPSKLFEVINVPREELEKDMAAGVITSSTTQKDLRDYANQKKQSNEKPVVLDRFTAYPWTRDLSVEMADFFSNPRTMGEWEEGIKKFVKPDYKTDGEVEVVKLPKAVYPGATENDKAPTLPRLMFHCAGEWSYLVVSFEKYKAPKTSKAGPKSTKGAMSMEQLQDLLAAQMGATPEVVKEVLNTIYGAAKSNSKDDGDTNGEVTA